MYFMVRLVGPGHVIKMRLRTGKMDGRGVKIAGCTNSRQKSEATEERGERDRMKLTEMEQAGLYAAVWGKEVCKELSRWDLTVSPEEMRPCSREPRARERKSYRGIRRLLK